jgi:hypothetical protein
MHFILIIPLLCTLYQKAKRLEYEFDKRYEGELLMYCITRNTIVCPRCRNIYDVDTLDQQMNFTWECTECGCIWMETPTHDIRR